MAGVTVRLAESCGGPWWCGVDRQYAELHRWELDRYDEELLWLAESAFC
jgi:hypothetical protein